MDELRRVVAHVAAVEVSEESGMGRVAWHWREAFERRGYEFLHIGPGQTGPVAHPALFPRVARKVCESLATRPQMVLVHEPAAGAFVGRAWNCVVFSHGVERREWERRLEAGWGDAVSRRTRLLYPIWRLRPCDLGMRRADGVLAISGEDREFILERYKRTDEMVHVFRNGVYASDVEAEDQPEGKPTILFVGTWIPRKGTELLVRVARELAGSELRWVLAGTGVPAEVVLRDWPEGLRDRVRVVPSFRRNDEASLFREATLFVLPSFFEGQPLALLQAMEAGRCCIASRCCGQKEFVTDGTTGLLHEPGDWRGVAALIEAAIADSPRRLAIGRAARAAMKTRTWPEVTGDVVDFVEGVRPRERC